MKTRVFVALLAYSAILFIVRPAQAGFIDFNNDPAITQTASWPEPSTIMVFIPGGIAGADRMNFEMGIKAWDDCLKEITVQFKDGDPPPGTANAVDIEVYPIVKTKISPVEVQSRYCVPLLQ